MKGGRKDAIAHGDHWIDQRTKDGRQRSYRGGLSEQMDEQGNEVDERWRSYREELSEWMDEQGNEANERRRSYRKELS